MKKQIRPIPTVSKYTVLRQLSNLIPPHLVPQLARETGVADRERTFSSWSQVVALALGVLSSFRTVRIFGRNDYLIESFPTNCCTTDFSAVHTVETIRRFAKTGYLTTL